MTDPKNSNTLSSSFNPATFSFRSSPAIPPDRPASALYWHRYGLPVIPVLTGQKRPAVDSWDNWREDLSIEKVKNHWELHPDHDIGCLMGDDLIMFDADTLESIANLVAIEESFGIKPKLLVKTARGEHHWFRRKPGTFASPDGHDSGKQSFAAFQILGRGAQRKQHLLGACPVRVGRESGCRLHMAGESRYEAGDTSQLQRAVYRLMGEILWTISSSPHSAQDASGASRPYSGASREWLS